MKKSRTRGSTNITQKVAAERKARLVAFVKSLPGADAIASDDHLSLEVGKKRFGWYLFDHHGDGRLAINCKAPLGVAQRLVKSAPERFHIPKFLGHLGWVGMWLDTPQIDWTEVDAILLGAYRMTASRKLIAEFEVKNRS